jgi:8-oxo-dGTP diphosphatase
MKHPQPPARPSPRPGHVFDWAVRVALWCAYHLLLVWWFLRRPDHHGTVIAIWVGPRILMIRHSYRYRWLSWPGGSIHRGEAPADAARRELKEETGLAIAGHALRLVGRALERWEWRYDYVSLFELRLKRAPSLRLDGREVIAASLMSPKEALAQPLVPFIRTYLEHHPRPGRRRRRASVNAS